MPTKHRNFKYYGLAFAWIGALQLVGYVMGMLTRTNIDSWYRTLERSPLTPPDYLFGIAWSLLYIMIAISGFILWHLHQDKSPELKQARTSFIIQLLLNWSWTPLFFIFHWTGTALVCLILILITTAYLLITSLQIDKRVSLLLLPYYLWLVFACYLNYFIWMHN